MFISLRAFAEETWQLTENRPWSRGIKIISIRLKHSRKKKHSMIMWRKKYLQYLLNVKSLCRKNNFREIKSHAWLIRQRKFYWHRSYNYCEINFTRGQEESDENHIIHIKVYKNLLFYMMKFYIITSGGDEKISIKRNEKSVWKKYCKKQQNLWKQKK